MLLLAAFICMAVHKQYYTGIPPKHIFFYLVVAIVGLHALLFFFLLLLTQDRRMRSYDWNLCVSSLHEPLQTHTMQHARTLPLRCALIHTQIHTCTPTQSNICEHTYTLTSDTRPDKHEHTHTHTRAHAHTHTHTKPHLRTHIHPYYRHTSR